MTSPLHQAPASATPAPFHFGRSLALALGIAFAFFPSYPTFSCFLLAVYFFYKFFFPLGLEDHVGAVVHEPPVQIREDPEDPDEPE